VYIDGGITKGTDVLKCLAMGASAVFLGRPASWSLQYGGADSVKYMLDMVTEELKLSMVLTSCLSIKDITAD
jgi:4-hydroxymandelate oxidase